MRVAFLLFVHFLVNVAKLVGPGGSKGLLAETLLVKHQLIVLNRSRRRAPNLTTWDRFLFGLTGFFMTPARTAKNTVVVSTATLFEGDALRCPSCGERMRIIAAITDPMIARRILKYLGLPPRAPPLIPPAPPETASGSWFSGPEAYDFDQTLPVEWDQGG